jgi:CRP-like cAMP-binding protein
MAEAPKWEEMKKIPVFSGLSENEIYDLFKLAFVKHYKAGATLFVEGMTGEILYVVLKGKVNICKKTNKDEIVIATMEEGDFFGELSLIDAAPRSATARVVADSELVAITKKVFDDMLNADPVVVAKLLIEFLKTAATRLRATDKKFESL